MSKSKSYKRAECCGDDCVLLDCYDDQPCWGETVVIDEDYWGSDWSWVHACEGHRRHRDGIPYIPEPPAQEEVKPTTCLECGNEDTLELNDGASGYCPQCGTSWANYIKMTLTIDSGGELVEDDYG